MINPWILIGLILAGAWASALCAADDELERNQSQEIDTKVGDKSKTDKLDQPTGEKVTNKAQAA